MIILSLNQNILRLLVTVGVPEVWLNQVCCLRAKCVFGWERERRKNSNRYKKRVTEDQRKKTQLLHYILIFKYAPPSSNHLWVSIEHFPLLYFSFSLRSAPSIFASFCFQPCRLQLLKFIILPFPSFFPFILFVLLLIHYGAFHFFKCFLFTIYSGSNRGSFFSEYFNHRKQYYNWI